MVDKSDPENKLKRQEEAEINSDFKIYLDNYKKLIDFNDQNDIEGIDMCTLLLFTVINIVDYICLQFHCIQLDPVSKSF